MAMLKYKDTDKVQQRKGGLGSSLNSLSKAGHRLSLSISDLVNTIIRRSEPETDTAMIPLHQAALVGNLVLVKSLLEASANPNIKDDKWMTALHYSTFQSNPEVGRWLLKHGSFVSAVNKDGSTPMHLACQQGNIEMVNLLLYFGADPSRKNNHGLTPLELACEYGRCKVVETLVRSRLCEHQLFADGQVGQQNSPMHLAARNGKHDVIRALLEAGCNIDYCTQFGSCLHEAVAVGKLNTVWFLLQAGAALTIRNHKGETLLEFSRRLIAEPNEVEELLNAAANSLYGQATKDFQGDRPDDLCLENGSLIWILDYSNDQRWKGAVFGPRYTSRSGYFPPSCVQVIDTPVGMHRSVSHNKVKKVCVPEVPDMPGMLELGVNGINGNCGQSTPNRGGSKARQSSSSYGSYSSDNSFPPPPSDLRTSTPESQCCVKPQASTAPPFSTESGSKANGELAFVFPPSAIHTEMNPSGIGSPRQRNSTGSNNSQASSGFESMKSNANAAYVNTQVQSIRDRDSPPSRNSYHSSGSSSLGSMERLDESGYSSYVNVAELLLNGAMDNEVICAWLQSIHYEEYIPLFLEAGYDMSTIARMTPEDLTAIGITRPGHRKRLTTEIHKLNVPDNLPTYKPDTLSDWLCVLGLPQYVDMFYAQNYKSIDDVSKLTWEDLEDIGIKSLGHLKKLGLAIKRLKELKQGRFVPDENGSISHGHSAIQVIPVHNMISQSHQERGAKLAEVKPYSHVMETNNPQSPRQVGGGHENMYGSASEMRTFAHVSPRRRPNAVVPPSVPPRLVSGYLNGHISDSALSVNAYDTFPPRGLEHTPPHATGSPMISQKPRVSVKPIVVGNNARMEAPSPDSLRYIETSSALMQNSYPNTGGTYANFIGSTNHCAILSHGPLREEPDYEDSVTPNGGGPIELLHCSPSKQGTLKKVPPPPLPPKSVSLLQQQGPPGSPAYAQHYHHHHGQNVTVIMSEKTNIFQLPGHHTQRTSINTSAVTVSNGTTSAPPAVPTKPSARVDLNESIESDGSIEDFPPPPSPLTCEESINALRTIRQNPSSASLPAAAAQTPSTASLSSGALTLPNESLGSIDSNSSTETLPFANENCGTIKQRSPRPAADAQCATTSNGSAPSVPAPPTVNPVSGTRRSVREIFPSQQSVETTHVEIKDSPGLPGEAERTGDVLDEIGNMLQGLTDELDALLLEPAPAPANT